ncbi:hypothetical protein ACFL5A_00270 [Gemmatimonadota bacterium]
MANAPMYHRPGDLRVAARPFGREAVAQGQRSVLVGRVAWWAVLLCLACGQGAQAPVLDLPPRPSDAPGGAELARDFRSLDFEAREDRIYAEVSRGNVPTWLRHLERVEITGEVDGRQHRVTFWVTPDYLAVGSDIDSFLIPLSPQVAQRIADLVGGSLPTPRMVDAIWASARVRLAPIRFDPDSLMTTARYFERHDRLVRAQRILYGVPPGAFVAGHKLDVVLTPTLSANPGKVALYGWHLPDGQPIQPLFTARADSRVGFSHGIRLVDRVVLVDGARRGLADVLRDPEFAPLLSEDGVITEARYPVQRIRQ